MSQLLYFVATYMMKHQMLCIELDVLQCTVENPENSLFWDTDPMRRLFETCAGFRNVFSLA